MASSVLLAPAISLLSKHLFLLNFHLVIIGAFHEGAVLVRMPVI